MQGDASLLNIKQQHRDCVKRKAYESVKAVRSYSEKEVIDSIERVFDRCYNDLEPLGRRLRRNSDDALKAYAEAPYFGYDHVKI